MNKLNFGSGTNVKKGWYNVDIMESSGIDKSFDFDVFPYPLENNKFDSILVIQVLEHCHYPSRVLEELWRISKNNAVIKIDVPYVNSKSANSNLEHCSYFDRWSFLYMPEKIRGKFITIKNDTEPQRFLRWIPIKILNLLSVFFNNILVGLNVELKCVKGRKSE